MLKIKIVLTAIFFQITVGSFGQEISPAVIEEIMSHFKFFPEFTETLTADEIKISEQHPEWKGLKAHEVRANINELHKRQLYKALEVELNKDPKFKALSEDEKYDYIDEILNGPTLASRMKHYEEEKDAEIAKKYKEAYFSLNDPFRYQKAMQPLLDYKKAVINEQLHGSIESVHNYKTVYTDENLLNAQRRLNELNIYNGKMDGQWGSQTRTALEKYLGLLDNVKMTKEFFRDLSVSVNVKFRNDLIVALNKIALSYPNLRFTVVSDVLEEGKCADRVEIQNTSSVSYNKIDQSSVYIFDGGLSKDKIKPLNELGIHQVFTFRSIFDQETFAFKRLKVIMVFNKNEAQATKLLFHDYVATKGILGCIKSIKNIELVGTKEELRRELKNADKDEYVVVVANNFEDGVVCEDGDVDFKEIPHVISCHTYRMMSPHTFTSLDILDFNYVVNTIDNLAGEFKSKQIAPFEFYRRFGYEYDRLVEKEAKYNAQYALVIGGTITSIFVAVLHYFADVEQVEKENVYLTA